MTVEIVANVYHISSVQCQVSKNKFKARNNLIFFGTAHALL